MTSKTLTVLALCALCSLGFGQAITFTGDVATDFAGSVLVADPGGVDVGIPMALPMGTVSGWDIANLGLSYDVNTDTLYVGIDTFGIAGDADGNGDPSTTGPELAGLGGADLPNFDGSEAFTFAMDLDGDGVPDFVCGVDTMSDLSNYRVATYNPFIPLFAPALAFMTPLPSNTGPAPTSPSAGFQDLEFTIPELLGAGARFRRRLDHRHRCARLLGLAG